MAKNKANNDPASLIFMRLMFKILTPFLPQIMNRLAYHLWITPPRTKISEKEQEFVKSADSRFLTIKDLKIKVWSWGKGPTVLFIHGWGGRGLQVSGFIKSLNNAGFNVMSFDMPAHGQSSGARTNGIEIVEIIDEVVKQIDNPHGIITHSFGGILIGNYYNERFPFKKIVMICPPATLNTAFNQFTTTLQLPQTVQEYIVKILKNNFGQDVFERFSLLKNGTKIIQPVLVVHDKQDNIVPYQEGLEIVEILKEGDFYQTNELGHQKILYDKTVIERILQFISPS